MRLFGPKRKPWWREWGAIVEDAKLRCALARLIERILKAAIYEYMLKSLRVPIRQ